MIFFSMFLKVAYNECHFFSKGILLLETSYYWKTGYSFCLQNQTHNNVMCLSQGICLPCIMAWNVVKHRDSVMVLLCHQ